ncbi:MAG: hypothetical protein IJI46_06440 [Erysipelotrichaceae bacterium]|nr:hypothetical protein [Erysipelotrichaceae bacterium]
MEYMGFIFGIFGLMAYLQLASLKKRVDELERQLSSMKGTSYHEKRQNLIKIGESYIGEKVRLELKEGYEDVDVMMYGNSQKGCNIIKQLDEGWVLVHIESPKLQKDKLIRLEAIEGITLIKE